MLSDLQLMNLHCLARSGARTRVEVLWYRFSYWLIVATLICLTTNANSTILSAHQLFAAGDYKLQPALRTFRPRRIITFVVLP